MITKKHNLPNCRSCIIRSNALFSNFDHVQLCKAKELRSEQLSFKPGEYLYLEGDTATKAYTVYNGWVILFKILENGNRQILRFALIGDFLGYKTEKNLIYDHSAIAVSKVTLCAYPLTSFRNTILKMPELALSIAEIADSAMQRCHSMLTTIASHPAEAKISFLLLSLFIRESAFKGDGKCIPFPITQEDISDALGLTSIHVNRVFQSLKKQGVFACRNRCLSVPNKNALAKKALIDLDKLEKLTLNY